MKRPYPTMLAALSVTLLLAGNPAITSGQDACTADRSRDAQKAYESADFGVVKKLLAPCIQYGSGTSSSRVQALRLMALTYLAEDSVEAARPFVQRLLHIDARYKSRAEIDPPRFVRLVDDERPPWISWLWQGGGWQRWLGRAAIAGAAVTVPMLLRPEAPPTPLPMPPTLPRM